MTSFGSPPLMYRTSAPGLAKETAAHGVVSGASHRALPAGPAWPIAVRCLGSECAQVLDGLAEEQTFLWPVLKKMFPLIVRV
jgi:hypothetical protein